MLPIEILGGENGREKGQEKRKGSSAQSGATSFETWDETTRATITGGTEAHKSGDIVGDGVAGHLSRRMEIQALHDSGAVEFGCPDGNVELIGNIFGAAALSDEM